MKNKLLLLILLSFSFALQAQNFIPFQGIALDGQGKALVSKKIGIKISILKDGASGTISYAESHAPTTDNNGLFQINIGSGTALTNTFAAIDWSTLNYFLKLEMDVNGGTSYSLISTTQMGFVPFAFYAKNGGTNNSLGINLDPQGNIYAGTGALAKNTTGYNNVAISLGALSNNTTGGENIAIGRGSLLSNTTGGQNISIGTNALYTNTTGIVNIALGLGALSNNTTGGFNIGISTGALGANTTGQMNIGIGKDALLNNTTGYQNTAIGHSVLISNQTGKSNTAIGNDAMRFNLASDNTALGQTSLYNNTIGFSNVGVGVFALYANKSGSKNSAFGVRSGDNIDSGTNLTTIGYESRASDPNASNEITFGDSNIKAIRSAVTSITSLSDARDKKNIQDLSLGLNFIQTLKPRSFQWDKREWYIGNTSDGSKLAKTSTAGFIAQELDESQQKFNADWLNLVYKSNPEKLEANYGNLIPIIVKALQELNDENKALKIEIEKLKNK